jgi:hypothetical protein
VRADQTPFAVKSSNLFRVSAVPFVLGLSFLACGKHSSGFDDPGAAAGGDGGQLGFGTDAGESDAVPPPIGEVTGNVLAPEGTIPISGALVYLTREAPAEIPSGTYCDKCVQLSSYAFTYSDAHGFFRLPVYEEGDQYMVTQKGQFRRVRHVTVHAGSQAGKPDDARLPGKNDAANGDTIPKMKVMQANWDSIANSLRKLGITEYDGPPTGFTVDHTLDDITVASKYHIIFIPCAGQTTDPSTSNVACSGIYAPSSGSKGVVKDFIQRGGKLYVTDWSYEYVNQTWPGFLSFTGDDPKVIGSACTTGDYSGPARFDDPSLKAWMDAIGEQNAQLQKNYVGVDGTTAQPGLDENGQPVTITPKVWASTLVGGAARIATVSFQDKCGRVMYSTYHAEGTDNGGSNTLLAQEKALFHILLEVSACVGVKPVPIR